MANYTVFATAEYKFLVKGKNKLETEIRYTFEK